MPETLNILFLAAEATPFVKVGGLADVAGALPGVLRGLTPQQAGGVRLDVRLVLPFHRTVQPDITTLKRIAQFSISRAGGNVHVQAYETNFEGLPVYFIDGLPVSTTDRIYSVNPEQDREKYIFFSLAALELAKTIKWKVDVVHANDWHTAVSLYAMRSQNHDSYFDKTAGLLSVHNLPYMGGNAEDTLSNFGIKDLVDDELPFWAWKQALPLGLWAADAIVPVSETYAREILTPEYGCGLQDFLKKRSGNITGIINGIEPNQWNPANDEFLASKYDMETLEAREKNKISLMRKIDLDLKLQEPLEICVTGHR
jgi:starch synthase